MKIKIYLMTCKFNFMQVDESKFFTFGMVGSITIDHKWTWPTLDTEQCPTYYNGQIVEIMTND